MKDGKSPALQKCFLASVYCLKGHKSLSELTKRQKRLCSGRTSCIVQLLREEEQQPLRQMREQGRGKLNNLAIDRKQHKDTTEELDLGQ